MQAMDTNRGNEKNMEVKKWKDTAGHKLGCPYIGVTVQGTAGEMAKYHSGYCPGCNILVKWEEKKQEKETAA
jgi:hypothetical protein